MLAPSDCPQGIQALSLPEVCNLHLPHLLVADLSVWAISPLGVVVKACILCVCVCVCFPLQVMLPSEIPKLPTDLLVTGFPSVGKLLLLHNSLPGTGFHP